MEVVSACGSHFACIFICPNIGWRIILKLIFKRWNGEAWTVLTWLRIGKGIGVKKFLALKASSSIKCEEFLDGLSTC